jgi:hypothetical protein
MNFYDYNKGNMNVCSECGEVSLWLDEYARVETALKI